MDPANWIFLTRSQALDAIAFDFQQYGPQPELFVRMVGRIPGTDCQVQTGKGGPQFLVSREDQPALGIPGERMGFFLIHLLESLPLSLETLADLSSQVLQTSVVTGTSSGRRGLWIEHGMEKFTCSNCGHCCRDLAYAHDCTVDDVRRWQGEDRSDILARVRGSDAGGYEIWINPDTGAFFDTCPWLSVNAGSRRHICTIHETKPGTCRQYPFTPKHAAMTGCRGRFRA